MYYSLPLLRLYHLLCRWSISSAAGPWAVYWIFFPSTWNYWITTATAAVSWCDFTSVLTRYVPFVFFLSSGVLSLSLFLRIKLRESLGRAVCGLTSHFLLHVGKQLGEKYLPIGLLARHLLYVYMSFSLSPSLFLSLYWCEHGHSTCLLDNMHRCDDSEG